MIRHTIGDMFTSDANVFVHQVNCKGIMGSGVAKQVRLLFPETYCEYKRMCMEHEDSSELLGYALTRCEQYAGKEIYVANLFAQDGYGYDGKRYTNYSAFRSALKMLKVHITILQILDDCKLKIAMPYRIGCDRGGGDWNVIHGIIEEELGDFDITLYELPKK